MKQLETKFKEKVIKDLKTAFKEKIKITKTQQMTQRGLPDLLICLYGDYVEIELKISGKLSDPLQQISLAKTIQTGGRAFYTTPDQWTLHLATLVNIYANRE